MYQITDIIHGVFNSGCAYLEKKGVHVLDECPEIHLLGTCVHALSKGQDMSTWKCVLWNYLKMHIICAVKMHISEACGHEQKALFYLAQLIPETALMQGVYVPKSWAQNYWLPSPPHVPISLSANSMPTSTSYAAQKNCLMFASKSPLAYLCVCYCLIWIWLLRHFLDIFETYLWTSNVPK